MFTYEAKVLKIVDGDTIDAIVDLGFSTFKKVRIRLYGINTPESRTRDKEEKIRGLAAKERLEQLLENNDHHFILQSHGVGKFGRCLGEIWVDDVNINKKLVTEGHAIEYYGGKR